VTRRPPRRSHRPIPFTALVLGLFLVSLDACKVDDKAFQSRVFRCDTSAADPLCGTDADGAPLQCFAARQIGATDFCAQACGDVPMSLPDEGAVCVQGAVKLKACNPTDDKDTVNHPNGACDRPEFGCLRTDMVPPAGTADEGVCITMKTCSVNEDCRDPVRSVCAATFLRELYAGHDNTLHADNLYCLQQGCDANATSCSPGESCLRKVVPAAADPPDICVPNCDSQGRCPPNHFCLRKISGPANPAVCIPGLLGFVCDTDVDCLVGKCVDDGGTGPGRGDNLRLCTITCANNDDCSKFDSEQGLFVCNTSTHHCVTPNAYRGATCDTDADCIRDLDSKCMRFAPTDKQGTCLHPCEANGSCLPRGGINQTCLPLIGETDPAFPICLPGFMGLPCFDDANCIGDLTCRGADLTTQPDPTPGICTALCQYDSDCAKNRWTLGGWCGAPDQPVCIPPMDVGADCLKNSMCSSGVCDLTSPPTAITSHKCVAQQP
jgi:hypothetical protein